MRVGREHRGAEVWRAWVEEAERCGYVRSGDARTAASCHCSGTHPLPTPYLPTPTYLPPTYPSPAHPLHEWHVRSGDARTAASCHCSGTHPLPTPYLPTPTHPYPPLPTYPLPTHLLHTPCTSGMFGQVMLGLLPHVIAQVRTPSPPPYLPLPTPSPPPPHPTYSVHEFNSVWKPQEAVTDGEWKCAMTTNTNMCYFSHFTADTFSSHKVEAGLVRHWSGDIKHEFVFVCFTAHQWSHWKVMFSQVFVCSQGQG